MDARDKHARITLVQLAAMSAVEHDWESTTRIREYLSDSFVGYRDTTALRYVFKRPMQLGWVERRSLGGGMPTEYRLTDAGREVMGRALYAMGAA